MSGMPIRDFEGEGGEYEHQGCLQPSVATPTDAQRRDQAGDNHGHAI